MEQTRKKTRVERDENNDKDEKIKDPNNVSKSWQELTYDVLCIIFKYLSESDLSNASKVCRPWLEAANSEKRTRGPVCLTRHLEDIRCTLNNWDGIKKDIIKCSTVKPSLSLFFTIGRRDQLSRRCHCNFLPPNCDSLSLDTYGVVINNTEKTGEESNDIVCMFLPAVSNIEISTLTFNMYDWEKSRLACCEQLKAAFETSSDSDCRKASCLMLFCKWDGRSTALNLLRSSKHWFPKTKPSVWGGIAKDLSICNFVNNSRVCKKSANCIAIVLSGTNMRTWTILLDANCNTKEKVEDELRTFKHNVQLKKHSMGFMFACCIRGVKMFNENNVESTIFKQLFPKISLVGCFGDGEFGEKILNDASGKKRTNWYNSVSTAFMILTYD